jgi:formamidopyrimidine-DNA glycosylase
MPELPEVETMRRQLEKKVVGQKLQGQRVVRVLRRGKILIFELENSYLLIHPKMTGQLIFGGKPAKHTRHIFRFDGGSQLIFNDIRKFGWWKTMKDIGKIEKEFGPEPLEINLKTFKNVLKHRPRRRIKPLLMNQKIIAGMGNIYSDEILYHAGVHPLKQIKTLKDTEIKRLFKSVRKVLSSAIKHQGSSVRNFRDAFGKKGNFVKYHKVYQKEGEKCARCSAKIKRIKIAGRSAHYCPKCQR